MKRVFALLVLFSVMSIGLAAGYDSSAEKVTTFQEESLVADHDFATVTDATQDVEVPVELVIVAPDLGRPFTAVSELDEKTSNGYPHNARPPPDRRYKKS